MDETARETLQRDRMETQARIRSLTDEHAGLIAATDGSNADDEHDPEGTTLAFERAQVDALLDAAQRHLTDLDAALARVDDGTYGVCAVCGEPIPAERLAARPATPTCVRCASRRP